MTLDGLFWTKFWISGWNKFYSNLAQRFVISVGVTCNSEGATVDLKVR